MYLIDLICSSSAEADFDNEDNGNSTSVHQDWLRDSSGGDCESLSPDQQPELEENSGELRLKKEIVCAICRALMLVNQMQGTLNDFEEVLVFVKDLFCHSNQSLTAYWPKIGEKLKNFLRNVVIRNLKSSQSALIKVILVIGML